MWKRGLVILLLMTAVGTTAAWLLGWFSEDPALADIRRLQAQLADPSLKDEDRFEGFQTLRSKMEGLSESARRSIWQNGARMFQQQMEARMDRVLALPPAERAKALDEDIDRMEAMRARFSPGGGPRFPPLPANLSDADRVNFIRGGLDRTTPQMRAKMNQYMRLMFQRRKERGLGS